MIADWTHAARPELVHLERFKVPATRLLRVLRRNRRRSPPAARKIPRAVHDDGFAFPALVHRLKKAVEHLAFLPIDRETLLGPLLLEKDVPALGVRRNVGRDARVELCHARRLRVVHVAFRVFGFERLQPLVTQLVEVFDAALRVITSSGELIRLEGAVGQLLLRDATLTLPGSIAMTRSPLKSRGFPGASAASEILFAHV